MFPVNFFEALGFLCTKRCEYCGMIFLHIDIT